MNKTSGLFYVIILSAFFFVNDFNLFAQNVDYGAYSKIYAPQSQKMNIVDSVALHTYCSLSKVLDANSRNKCYVKAYSPEFIEQNQKRQEQESLQNKQALQNINQRLDMQSSEIDIIKNTKYKPQNNLAGNTVIKYVGRSDNNNNNNNYNTVVSKRSFAFGDYNTIAIEAPDSFVLGSHIVNTKSGSVQIGTSNKSKLFIGKDGFVGIANSNKNGAVTERLVDEQLRVAGRVRAEGFDIDAAADLAENFPADEAGIVAGNIIQFSNVSHKWTSGKKEYDLSGVVKAISSKNMIGVVATNPGILLGSSQPGVPVAFSGRVPVLVSSENGTVQKGDRVTLSSAQNGIGAKLIGEGQSVGIALSSDTGSGNVLLLVKNEYVSNPDFYK